MKLIKDMSSNDYHSEKDHYSSSQLKDMIYSPKLFYKKYITREIPREENPAFDIGTYFHTAILEPHLLNKECAVYEGTRAGKKWEEFKTIHAGKAIITKNEKEKAMNCVNAIRQCPISQAYVDLGTPEVSAFIDVYVSNEKIYYYDKKKLLLFVMTYSGWEKIEIPDKEQEYIDDFLSDCVRIGLKVRADSIDLNGVTVSDLKSASGDVSDEYAVQNKTSDLMYDLSAALYLDIFSAVIGRTYTDFIWLYASKTLHEKLNAPIGKPWRADADNIMIGRAKWTKAVIEIAKYISLDWKMESDSSVLVDLPPKREELIWLNKSHLAKGEFILSDLTDIKKQIEINKTKPKAIRPNKRNFTMEITNVNYARTIKTADYESETIGFSASLEAGEDAKSALIVLKNLVAETRTGASTTSEEKAEKKKSPAKLEEKKEEEPKKEEAKKEKKEVKKKTVVFDYNNDDHRTMLGGLLDKKVEGWRQNPEAKAAAKGLATSPELKGAEFLDASGDILSSFEDMVMSKMGKFTTEEDDL